MPDFIVFVVGVIFGALLVFLYFRKEGGQAQNSQSQAYLQALQESKVQTEQALRQMREAFGTLSHQALSQNTEDFLNLAELLLSKKLAAGEQSLTGKKALIDQTLQAMRQELGQLQHTLKAFEQDRSQSYGQLSQQLKHTAMQTEALRSSTDKLKQMLSDTKTRGQWGERMAEDLLTLIGMKEGINYAKQATGSHAQRPDFTFFLPQGKKIHMDVKFPLNSYLKYADAANDEIAQQHLAQFLKDVKQRLREVQSRRYIDPDDQTVDYLLIFIPNEAVYHFVMEQAPELLDEALRQKTILCSPFTLYAILSVVRQAVDNFNMEARASELRTHLSNFREQWIKYNSSMDKLGKKIEDTQREYQQLSQTRTKQLDKALQKLDLPTENQPEGETGDLFDRIPKDGE